MFVLFVENIYVWVLKNRLMIIGVVQSLVFKKRYEKKIVSEE